jgi:hypothetical protein
MDVVQNKLDMNKKLNGMIEDIGDNHILTNIETPMLPDVFQKTDAEKIENIKGYYQLKMLL